MTEPARFNSSWIALSSSVGSDGCENAVQGEGPVVVDGQRDDVCADVMPMLEHGRYEAIL
jgi:hypothetical protein